MEHVLSPLTTRSLFGPNRFLLRGCQTERSQRGDQLPTPPENSCGCQVLLQGGRSEGLYGRAHSGVPGEGPSMTAMCPNSSYAQGRLQVFEYKM